eukprot:m.494772 g.494772  ORF g.494772 m.494772 type:complete len:515 (-) comp41735_c0_seq1:29-1573(-)
MPGALHTVLLLAGVLLGRASLLHGRQYTPLDNLVHHAPNGHGVLKPMPTGRLNALNDEPLTTLGNESSTPHLLQVSGMPSQRGFAHGYLLAPQIIDWCVLYLLNTNMRGSLGWYNTFSTWWSKAQYVPPAYAEEAQAMLKGMVQRANDDHSVSLHVPELGRDFALSDIYMINSYLEATLHNSALKPGPYVGSTLEPAAGPPAAAAAALGALRTTPPACSQFVTWGQHTAHGETLAGRNMDGETDPAPGYVTVRHLLVTAVDGTAVGERRFLSVMWPGHIGGLSLINEDGLYLMLNCGSMGPGAPATNITAIEYFMRHVVATMSAERATPDAVKAEADRFSCTGGGASGAGSVIVFARPTTPNTTAGSPAGFVLEADRFGNVVRGPAVNDAERVVQTNHFVSYGVDGATEPSPDPQSPWLNFGLPVATANSSSYWRLEALLNGLRSHAASGQQLQGLPAAQQLLLRPVHGTTEHSVVFAPNRRQLALAVANPFDSGRWDAPYQSFRTYDFDELFE